MEGKWMDQSDVYTVDEARKIIKVGKNTMYSLLKREEIKGYRSLNRTWRITKEAINQYLFIKSKE